MRPTGEMRFILAQMAFRTTGASLEASPDDLGIVSKVTFWLLYLPV